MRIRTVLIGIGLAGNLLLALSLFFLFNYRDATQRDFANESLVSTYEAAWFQTLETSFDSISTWLPITGERGTFWDPENPIYPEEELSSEEHTYANPLIQFVVDKNISEAGYLLDLMFEFDLDEGDLSFIKAYYPSGQRFYCSSALDLSGIDPCNPLSENEYDDNLEEFLADASKRPRRFLQKIKDSSGEKISTLNQMMAFPIKAFSRNAEAIIVMGIDVRKSMETFGDEFELVTAIQSEEGIISLGEDYARYESGLELDESANFGITNIKGHVDQANLNLEEFGNRTSTRDGKLGSLITLLPLSSYLSSDKAQLFIFRDESESIAQENLILNTIYIISIIVILLVIGFTTLILASVFGSVNKAIEVLQALTSGDLTKTMPQRRGILRSENDEVGELAKALEIYRGHLNEMETIRFDQARRRKERDTAIIEKMSILADELEGDSRTLILNDINRMQNLAQESSEEKGEDASVELMTVAFTRMADEVQVLIDTRTKEMEESRDDALEANEQRSKFFANMSHELRTPLNAILGYGEMLYEECEDLGYEDLMPDLKKITTSGTHLLSLINNILDLSKIESGKMELYITSFEIEKVVETLNDINAPLAAKNDNGFKINIQEAIGSMSQDETKLRQCVTNFLSNAFKFTQNGLVSLDVSSLTKNGIDMIEFKVTDDGEGMSDEGVSKVFEEYEQAERSTSATHGGTGLGLPISKRFAELMGGGVTVSSEKGVGSIFSIFIPRICEETEELENEEIETLEGENICILIDDDIAMHDLIKRTVKKAGMTLIGATNGEQGLNMIRETKPKLILLDVLMPGRDGWSILKECKSDEAIKDIPVIMVSQMSQETLAFSLGADDYLTKPIDRDKFLNTVTNLLGTSDNKKILIVDDDANTRDILGRALKDSGYEPFLAKDGKEGLDNLKKNPALIVLDLEMPRMDGFEFLENFVDMDFEKRPNVLVYSGKDLSEVQEDLLRKNVAGLVKKDEVSINQLPGMVTKLLGSKA
jgi:signal transduction histidine kinase/DNA-binding response OmpR family regulator